MVSLLPDASQLKNSTFYKNQFQVTLFVPTGRFGLQKTHILQETQTLDKHDESTQVCNNQDLNKH